MNTYLKVRWTHDYRDEPVLLLSELDPNRCETRKVEVFADGTMGYASANDRAHGTQLGEVPVAAEEEICADPQFSIEAVTGEEFERVWESAPKPGKVGCMGCVVECLIGGQGASPMRSPAELSAVVIQPAYFC